MPIHLEFKDLNHFQPLHATDLNYAGAIKNQTVGAEVALFHPIAGRVAFTSMAMPHLQILQMDWQTGAEAVRIHGHEQVTRTIGVSFQTAGFMLTRFRGIRHDLEMRAGRNNLVFTPEPGDAHQFATNQRIGALQMNLDEEFFRSCIGTDDRWATQTLLNLEAGRAFSAVDNSAATTPQMVLLIDSIVNCTVQGPMRNLMIQSRALELLALQFDQFRGTKLSDTILLADAEKLLALKDYLDQHFLTEFSLTQLSRKFLINEFKLKKGFKQLFDHTVFGYIKKLRMEHALLLLKNTATAVDEVAYLLGYENSNHFSVAFKKYYGSSPSVHLRKSQHLIIPAR